MDKKRVVRFCLQRKYHTTTEIFFQLDFVPRRLALDTIVSRYSGDTKRMFGKLSQRSNVHVTPADPLSLALSTCGKH